MKTQKGKSLVVMLVVMGFACVQSAHAQTFKKVNVNGNVPLVQVSSGGASVWALASNGNPYIFSGEKFVLANTISLSQIDVGGGSAAQADAVWALNSSGNVFRARKSGTSWVFSQVSGVLDLIQVGPGYHDGCHPYEVWGLNASSQVYRFDFCANNFVQVPGVLCDIRVGGDNVWGAQCGPTVFRFNFSTLVFEEDSPNPFGGFPALTVGPNGVWAVDSSNTHVWEFSPGGWIGIGQLAQVQAGGNGVWGLDSSGNIWRLETSGRGFVPVGGSLVSISVGSGGGVWGINSSNQVFKFTTP